MKLLPTDYCCICGSDSNIERHHWDWNHRNNEPANVFLVCRPCHVWLHRSGFYEVEEIEEVRRLMGVQAPRASQVSESPGLQSWKEQREANTPQPVPLHAETPASGSTGTA